MLIDTVNETILVCSNHSNHLFTLYNHWSDGW